MYHLPSHHISASHPSFNIAMHFELYSSNITRNNIPNADGVKYCWLLLGPAAAVVIPVVIVEVEAIYVFRDKQESLSNEKFPLNDLGFFLFFFFFLKGETTISMILKLRYAERFICADQLNDALIWNRKRERER